MTRPYGLHLGDALAFMATLPDESVDALITDPPYGTTQNDYERSGPQDWGAFMREAARVARKPQNIIVFAAQPFTTDLISAARDLFRYDLIWRKSLSTGHLNARHMPLRTHEHILVFGRHGATYNPQLRDKVPRAIGRRAAAGAYGEYDVNAPPLIADENTGHPYSVIDAKTAYHEGEAGLHPSQKPTALMAYLINTYTNQGDLILDPFAGSGTTGVAALRGGRRFMGSELSPEYHAVALKRLEAAHAQPRLLEAL